MVNLTLNEKILATKSKNLHFVKSACLTFILCLSLSATIFGQADGNNYKTAIGVKFYPTGVTLKTFMKSNLAFEAIGYFWERGTRITGLFEYHYPISSNGALKWYIGPGVHVGFYKQAYYNGGTSIGLDGVLGLDYKFPGIPLNVSLDWQPSYEFGNYAGFSGNWGGLGLRLAF